MSVVPQKVATLTTNETFPLYCEKETLLPSMSTPDKSYKLLAETEARVKRLSVAVNASSAAILETYSVNTGL